VKPTQSEKRIQPRPSVLLALLALVAFVPACDLQAPSSPAADSFEESGAGLTTTSSPAYAGCYTDAATRALPVQLASTGATVESCIAAAVAQNLAYAGVQYGGVCFGGNALGYTLVADSDCNMPCKANSGETCGGTWRNSIYRTASTANYKGCYTDDAKRALPTLLLSSGATVETCIAAAKAANLPYAGVQYGGVCFGGNTLGYTLVANSDCNMPCKANSAEICGGTWRNSIYSTEASAPAPTPAPTPTPVSVSVAPQTASVAPGGSVQLTASVTGSTNTTVTWTVQEGAAGGAVSSTGLYTAPSSPGTYHVIAKSSADASKTATATLNVVAGVSVSAPNGADDTAAFNSAIAAANGGTVVVPASSRPYVVANVQVTKAGTTIQCVGAPTIKMKPLPTGDGSPMFRVKANNVTFKDCTFDGNWDAHGERYLSNSFAGRVYRSGIAMHQDNGALMSGLTVTGCTFNYFQGAQIITRETEKIVVTDTTFDTNMQEALWDNRTCYPGTGCANATPRFLDGLTFQRNTVRNAGCQYKYGANGCNVNGGSVTANGGLLSNVKNVIFTDNVFQHIERNAFKFENMGGSAQQRSIVANNTVSDITFGTFAGFQMQNGVHFATFSGNDIRNTAGAGIHSDMVVSGQYGADPCEDVIIENNKISNTRRFDGIRFLCHGAYLKNVTIRNNTLTSVTDYPIDVRQYIGTGGFSNINITGNTANGYTAGLCIYLYGQYGSPTNVISSPNTCVP
jgi:hypothetical protein